MRIHWVLALAIVAALAGCVGKDSGAAVAPAAVDEDEPMPPADGAAGSQPEPASPPAGEPSSGGSEGAAPAEAEDPPQTAEDVRIVPIVWEGRTRTAACLPSGPGSCMGPGAPTPADDLQATGVTGRVSGDLALTWEAQTPAAEELTLTAWSARPCGDSCWESAGNLSISVTGASPLSLALPETLLGPDETIVLTVRAPWLPTPDPVLAYVGTEQAFHLEGALRVAT